MSRPSETPATPTAPLLVRVAAPEEAGARLDVAVAGWLGESRSRTQQRLAAGEVTVGGRPAAKNHRLTAGDEVVVAAPATPPPPPAPPHVAVRWRDEHLAVVAKPAGLVVHAGAGHRDVTLVDALRAQGLPLADTGDPDRPGIVHRLDRGTSGLLVVALSAAAVAGLRRQFAAHDVEREYWALVEGTPDPPRATIDAPIARHATNRTVFTTSDTGRRAVSHYDVLRPGGDVAEVAVRLETGRTHQVRVHLAAIGHPVAGDLAYGADAALAERLGLTRPALHARVLGLVHPVTAEPLRVEEPLPEDLLHARASGGPARG